MAVAHHHHSIRPFRLALPDDANDGVSSGPLGRMPKYLLAGVDADPFMPKRRSDIRFALVGVRRSIKQGTSDPISFNSYAPTIQRGPAFDYVVE